MIYLLMFRSDNLKSIFSKSSKAILLDLNGEPDVPSPIHLSEKDLVEKIVYLADPKVIFYGTHLKYQKKSKNRRIKYVKPGMDIEI